MSGWEASGGGTVEVTATGLYIDGEFLADRTTDDGEMTGGTTDG